jgi:hypothetical protein
MPVSGTWRAASSRTPPGPQGSPSRRRRIGPPAGPGPLRRKSAERPQLWPRDGNVERETSALRPRALEQCLGVAALDAEVHARGRAQQGDPDGDRKAVGRPPRSLAGAGFLHRRHRTTMIAGGHFKMPRALCLTILASMATPRGENPPRRSSVSFLQPPGTSPGGGLTRYRRPRRRLSLRGTCKNCRPVAHRLLDMPRGRGRDFSTPGSGSRRQGPDRCTEGNHENPELDGSRRRAARSLRR